MGSVYLPVFDGNNYEFWSAQMKRFLKVFDVWDVVEMGIHQQEPVQVTPSTSHEFEGVTSDSFAYDSFAYDAAAENYSIWWKQWMERKDAKALSMIQTGVSIEIFPWIAYAKSSKEAWDLLMVRSVGGPIFQARKLLDLKNEYKNMSMSDAETILGFTEKLMKLVFRMKSCGWKVEDKEVVKKILSSLPPKFNRVLVDVAETLSVGVLIDCLLVHEYNMRPDQESLEEPVIQNVNVEEGFQAEAEILYSLDEITQNQVGSMERQKEVLSLVQQNQKMIMEMLKQKEQVLLHSEPYDNQDEEMTRVIESLKKQNLKKK